MGWESFGVVGFDLELLLQGQTRIAKVNSAYNSLIIGPRGLGIFWCGRIRPWAPSSGSNKDSQA